MTFSALLDTAMAGSQRRNPQAALTAWEKLPPERRLLRSASYEGLRRLAGRPVDRVEDVISIEPCGPEALQAVPALSGVQGW